MFEYDSQSTTLRIPKEDPNIDKGRCQRKHAQPECGRPSRLARLKMKLPVHCASGMRFTASKCLKSIIMSFLCYAQPLPRFGRFDFMSNSNLVKVTNILEVFSDLWDYLQRVVGHFKHHFTYQIKPSITNQNLSKTFFLKTIHFYEASRSKEEDHFFKFFHEISWFSSHHGMLFYT